ncbi:kynureninase [Streptomyces olivaceus]
MSTLLSRAEELDADDPLAHTRKRFLLPDGVTYLDGNSLGPVPVGVPGAMDDAVRGQWGEGLVRSWPDWMRLPLELGDRIGRLLGAGAGNTVVGDSTSVQIFNALASAARLRPGRGVLLTDVDHFPTDQYLADSVGRLLGLAVRRVPAAEFSDHLRVSGGEVAVVACPAVDYRTGQLWDIAEVTAAAHRAGAVVVWDLCHAVGALPLELDAAGVDLAVGCTYKYLNGGPGSPAFIYVNPRHQDRLDQPLTGWLGHAEPFSTTGTYRPAPGVARAVIGTPPVLSTVALQAALDVYEDVSMDAVRTKSLSLTGFFMGCVDELLAEWGFAVVTPRRGARRGSQVALRHPDAYGLVQALLRRRVIGDMRPPDLLRFGFNALYLTHREVYAAVRELHAAVAAGEQHDPGLARRSPFG